MIANMQEIEYELDRRERVIIALLSASKAVFAQIEEGNLVRDISHDHEHGWAMRHIPMIKSLAQLREAIALAEGGKIS